MTYRQKRVESVILADLPVPKDIVVTDLDEISRRVYISGTLLYSALSEEKTLYKSPD